MNGILPFDPADAPLPVPPDLARHSTVTIDTETTGLEWVKGDRPVGIAVRAGGQSHYLPFGHVGGANLDAGIVKRWAQRELRGKRIIGFNLSFDLHQLRCWGVDLREQGNSFHDASHDGCLLDDHRLKSRLKLEDFAQDYLGEGKTNIGRPAEIHLLPGNTVAPYACRDVDLTEALHDVFQPKIAAEDLGRVQALEDACIPATVELESHGLPIDVERAESWKVELQRIADLLIRELHRVAGFACTPSKKPDMARLFHAAQITYGRTPTGQPEFPAHVKRAAAERAPAIQLAYRWEKVQHLLSKVIVPFTTRHVNGVLHPRYHQMMGEDGGTISGRYASSNPNGQNLLGKDKYERAYGWLREYSGTKFLARDLVICERGVFVGADQAQVEYRIAAHYAEDEALIQQYRDHPDLDQHTYVQSLIRPYRRDVTRGEAKAPGFARLYGGGVGTVASNLNIGEDEAQVLVNAYDRAFPAYGRLFNRVKDVAERRGYVRTFLGRRCRFLGPPGRRERTHKSLNHVCQGTGADLAKQALVAVYEQRKALGITCRFTEHDALGGDLEGPLQPLLDLLNVQRMPLRVPIVWSAKTGRTWAEVK